MVDFFSCRCQEIFILYTDPMFFHQFSSMSKRRLSERGSGETSGRASRQCPGISGNNAKRAGPFILGKKRVFFISFV